MANARSIWPEQSVLFHRANRSGRDFVIGDLHGHFDTLEHALGELRFSPGCDRLFSEGDLIDRGPRSADALEWLTSRRILAVRGNHEQLMIDGLTLDGGRLTRSSHAGLWVDNGGGWFWGMAGFDEDDRPLWRGNDHRARRAAWLDAMRQVPYLREIETAAGTIGIVHTLADGHADWGKRKDDVNAHAEHARHAQAWFVERAPTDILWSRPAIQRTKRDAPDLPPAIREIDQVLVGHSPGPHPRWIRSSALCIDTGVHVREYGHLTIAQIESRHSVLHRFARID